MVVPVFPWAETASNAAGPAGRSFLRFVQWLGERYGPRVALADYSRVKFAGYGAAPDTPPSLTTYSGVGGTDPTPRRVAADSGGGAMAAARALPAQ